MEVKLIRYTPDPDELVGRAAAKCYASKSYDKARQHAMKSGHTSIAEHVTFTFEVAGVSRALLGQITRHRHASFSVESQRYVSMEDFQYVVPDSIKNDKELLADYNMLMDDIKWFYQKAVCRGVPKEDARFASPQAACTTFLITANARELLHFFSLRTCRRAQWEIRLLARLMLEQCLEVAPKTFETAGPGCVRGKCPEGDKSCGKPMKSGIDE